MTPQDIRQFEITGIYRACAAGAVVSVDPELAEEMGAFEETALSAGDAGDARFDCDPKTGIVLDFDRQPERRPKPWRAIKPATGSTRNLLTGLPRSLLP